jgi:EAL domain-containing protein (putative c-di-GMP-specific phosphodiesterase class I)
MNSRSTLFQTVASAQEGVDLLDFAPPMPRRPRFDLAVQAIVSVSSERRPAWVECLVRPPAAEPGGSVMEVVRAGYRSRGFRFDLDVLDAALLRLPALREDTCFGINIRPDSLTHAAFVDGVLERLTRTGTPPHRLVLELVEYAGAVDLARTAAALGRLRRAGVVIALDDFGPGAPNFDVVAAGLVDWIKLDCSVCRRIDTHAGDRRVVEGLAALVRHAGPGLVAEGIERPTQMQALRRLGIVHHQGFLFHRPAMLPAPLGSTIVSGSTH